MPACMNACMQACKNDLVKTHVYLNLIEKACV